MNRYYLGFILPADAATHVADATAAIRADTAAPLDWTPPAALHCTLIFLGHIDDPVTIAAEATATIAQLPAPTLSIRMAPTWLGEHLVLPCTGADTIANALISRFGHLSDDPDLTTRAFFGHVTIARGTARSLPSVLSGPPRPSGPSGPSIDWTPTHVELIRNHGNNHIPRYTVADAFPLTAPTVER